MFSGRFWSVGAYVFVADTVGYEVMAGSTGVSGLLVGTGYGAGVFCVCSGIIVVSAGGSAGVSVTTGAFYGITSGVAVVYGVVVAG